ncbi:MAG TPA: hypothetical protein V6D15_22610 [Oculatellaceae cyanobacterium]|jgi:ribosomal protein L37AE/L43A
MRLNTCPCCGNSLLRHARQKGIYWFCTSCRQEMMPLNLDNVLRREVLAGSTVLPQPLKV